MNIKKYSAQLFAIAAPFFFASCYAIGVYPKNTAKSVADTLDTIPIGTPISEMIKDPRLNRLNFQKPASARFDPIGALIINPFDKDFNGLHLYRQFPNEVLLKINDDDLHGEIGVSEKIDRTGIVDVFYDKNYRFKGYFAYSFVRYSEDGDRLKVEIDNFRKAGMEDLARRCRQWAKLVGAGPELQNTIPHLPLSQYVGKDGSQ